MPRPPPGKVPTGASELSKETVRRKSEMQAKAAAEAVRKEREEREDEGFMPQNDGKDDEADDGWAESEADTPPKKKKGKKTKRTKKGSGIEKGEKKKRKR